MDEKTFSDRMYVSSARRVGKTALMRELGMLNDAIRLQAVTAMSLEDALAATVIREHGGMSKALLRRKCALGDDECAALVARLVQHGILSSWWAGKGRAEMVGYLQRRCDGMPWTTVVAYFRGGYGDVKLSPSELHSRWLVSGKRPIGEWIYRGTGRTTEQMKKAPKGAIFIWDVWHAGSGLDYPRALAAKLGRTDLSIEPQSSLRPERLRGICRDIVVDHAVGLSGSQQKAYNEHRSRMELCGESMEIIAVDEISPELVPLAELAKKMQDRVAEAFTLPSKLVVEAEGWEVFRTIGGEAHMIPSRGPLRGVNPEAFATGADDLAAALAYTTAKAYGSGERVKVDDGLLQGSGCESPSGAVTVNGDTFSAATWIAASSSYAGAAGGGSGGSTPSGNEGYYSTGGPSYSCGSGGTSGGSSSWGESSGGGSYSDSSSSSDSGSSSGD